MRVLGSVEEITINAKLSERDIVSRIMDFIRNNPKVKRLKVKLVGKCDDELKVIRVSRLIYMMNPSTTVEIYY